VVIYSKNRMRKTNITANRFLGSSLRNNNSNGGNDVKVNEGILFA